MTNNTFNYTPSQREYKELKKEVLAQGVREIGYFDTIIPALPTYALIEASRSLAEIGGSTWPDWQVQDYLVYKSIETMNYQDFKTICPHLFSYKSLEQAAIREVEQFQVAQEDFESFKRQEITDKLAKPSFETIYGQLASYQEANPGAYVRAVVSLETGIEDSERLDLMIDRWMAEDTPYLIGEDFYGRYQDKDLELGGRRR